MTTPSSTTPPPTTPQEALARCAVAGPAFEDRRAPLRAALGANKTIIAVTQRERRAFPDPLPPKVEAHLEEVGALLAAELSRPRGMISQKVLWRRDRRAAGWLHIMAKRIDAPGGRFRADLDRQYGGRRYSPFIPGALQFSDTGCWRVKARAGRKRVTYVVLVRRPIPGEFAPYLE